jgi:hypothetical protein
MDRPPRLRGACLLLLPILALAGCSDAPALATLLEPVTEGTPRFGVVHTDFTSSTVSLLDETGEVLTEDWITSGTVDPILVAALSGDVVLPTVQPLGGRLFVIDRFFTDVVTHLRYDDGGLICQGRTQGPDAEFSSNPQAILTAGDGIGWVTRFEPNLTSGAPALDRGTDLRAMDLDTCELLDRRIDLTAVADATATVEGEGGPMEVTVHGRPAEGVVLGSNAVVGLLRQDSTFAASAPGAVAIVDLEGETASLLEIPDLRTCGEVRPVPGDDRRVLVGCTGFAFPFGDLAQLRATAGLALVLVDDGVATVEHVFRAANVSQDLGIPAQNAFSLGGTRAVAVAWGSFDPAASDVAYIIDVATGDATELFEGGGAFTIGEGVLDPETDRILVPDQVLGVLPFRRAGDGTIAPDGDGIVTTSAGLAPAAVTLLR